MVTVPNVATHVPALRENPIVAYLGDNFQKPIPLQPEIVVGIDGVIEKKVDMLHCHVSQFYEWLPWNQQNEADCPKSDRERREFLKKQRLPFDETRANLYREKLNELYGRKAGSKFKYAEAFEVCEYGGRMTPEKMRELFPFVKSGQGVA